MTAAEKSMGLPEPIDPGMYYTVKQAARLLQCSTDKLNIARMKGELPEYSKWGNQVRYKGQSLIDALEGSKRSSTSDVG